MAVTEKDITELLKQINGKPLEDTHYQWTADPIEPFPSISLTDTGTLHSTYGAVPNVTIGSTSMSTTGTTANAFWTSTGTTTSGPVWTTTGTNTVWQTANPYTVMGAGMAVEQSGTLKLQGEKADIDINGKSLKTWMERVEERLNILTPNPEMEKDWDDLRKLGERYRKLEKKCREKADMWKKLKSMPRPDLP